MVGGPVEPFVVVGVYVEDGYVEKREGGGRTDGNGVCLTGCISGHGECAVDCWGDIEKATVVGWGA